ncbi:MAG: hypothetical protein TE42_09035 [Candidatus Synechococcus spongiarum SP3]|uniref:Uncharacterized protein n=1 Tax=Candidatus Synechococcus spongiarum SP3 TaxID=1604020 RepID=A0A0G2IVN2_9SYNE|nr:MAG: hypothetical protein TE42_09035 [Candidatus Synechococcus spongiarum SP3]
MILPREGGERRGNQQYLGAAAGQEAIELGKTHVVANGKPQAAQPRHVCHWRAVVTGAHGGGFLIRVPIGQVHVKEVNFVVAGQ